ncbi:helix-turn-helix transcriptional regulator [Enterobacter asburiae]|uniref:helix-turn-helix transcriptional regulator n=1 Tax=Enterobacter asburiae TaxID=61645 RepID=UPI0038968CA0
MFIFNLRAVLCNQTYLHGLTLSLNDMLNHNPEWSYRLLCDDDHTQVSPHLIVMDFTSHESLEQVTTEEHTLLTTEKGYRLLLLVHTNQKRLITSLFREYTCSLLSVDESTFQIRDVVDASLRKCRYLSPSIQQSRQGQIQPNPKVLMTSAEAKVLEYMMKGKTGIQIAHALFRSQKTVSSHKRKIMKKLGAKDDLQLKLIMLERQM